MSRRRRASAPVEWRNGVHITGTMLWCDARQAHDVCFVSSAQVADARRHRQIVAPQATLDLLPEPPARALATPFDRPFTLGELRLELFASGHMVGAAALLVDVGGARVVYAGPVDPRPGRLAGPAAVRACDVLVVDARLGRFELPPADAVHAELAAWVDDARAAGATPVLLAAPLSIGPELVRHLGGTRTLRAHRSFVDAARKLRALGYDLPPVARFVGPPPPGTVVLWPPGSRAAPAIRALRQARVALVSALALDPAARAAVAAEAGFALADQAGAAELTSYAAATGAHTVYLVGAADDRLALALAERGVTARRLGPPEQLSLL
jgi:hypothetical protein